MKRAIAVGVLAAVLGVRATTLADEPPPANIGNGEESSRSKTVRSAYFPFLAIGHGILLVAQYGVGYPIYFLTKPGVDFFYSSTDDATDVPSAAALNSRQLGTTGTQRR